MNFSPTLTVRVCSLSCLDEFVRFVESEKYSTIITHSMKIACKLRIYFEGLKNISTISTVFNLKITHR